MATISHSTRFAVLKAHGFRCAYCGRSSDEVRLEVDHIHPRSGGGSNKVENLAAACYDCNRGKRDSIVSETSTIARIKEVRDRHSLIHAELYCRNQDCPTRETRVYFKDYNNTLLQMLSMKGGAFKCCLCRRPMAVHWVKDARQYNEDYERSARQSVNTQIAMLRNGGSCNLRELLDDSLPVDVVKNGQS